MATRLSTQAAAYNAIPLQKLTPKDMFGRVRTYWFDRTSANPTDELNGDTITLTKIPAGSKILRGHLAFEAMGTSATIQIGVSGTAGKYLGSTSVAAAGVTPFADTVALNCGEILAAETELIATLGGADYTAAKKLIGYVQVVVD